MSIIQQCCGRHVCWNGHKITQPSHQKAGIEIGMLQEADEETLAKEVRQILFG